MDNRKFKLINKTENSAFIDTHIFEILPPLEEINCKYCDDKKLFVKYHYLRKTPVFIFKNEKLNRIFFRVPVLYCQNCNHIRTYNAGFFKKINVDISNLYELAKNL